MYNLAMGAVGCFILGGIVYNLSRNKSTKQKNQEVERPKAAVISYSSGTSKNRSTRPNETGILLFHPSLYRGSNYDSDDYCHEYYHGSDSHHLYDNHSHHSDSSYDGGGSFSSCD